MGCFSGRLMSAASDQKLFCKLCSPFCCSFDEVVEEKVISPVLFLRHLDSSYTIFLNCDFEHHWLVSPILELMEMKLYCMYAVSQHISLLFFFFNLFIYGCVGLHCCMWASLVSVSGVSPSGTVWASHCCDLGCYGVWAVSFSSRNPWTVKYQLRSCSAQAELPHAMRYLPRPGIQTVPYIGRQILYHCILYQGSPMTAYFYKANGKTFSLRWNLEKGYHLCCIM